MKISNSPISFNARIVFKNPKIEVKPFIEVENPVESMKNLLPKKKKTKPPTWLETLIFGLRKNTKLPSNKAQ